MHNCLAFRAVVVVVVFYLAEYGARRKANIYKAWQVLPICKG